MSLFLQLLEAWAKGLQKQQNNIDSNVTAAIRDWYCATVSILVKSAAHECHHKNPWSDTVPGLLQGFTWDDSVPVHTRDRCVNRAESLTVVGLHWRARKFSSSQLHPQQSILFVLTYQSLVSQMIWSYIHVSQLKCHVHLLFLPWVLYVLWRMGMSLRGRRYYTHTFQCQQTWT